MGTQAYWFEKLEKLQKSDEKVNFIESQIHVVSSKSLNDSVKKDLDKNEEEDLEKQQKAIAENTKGKKSKQITEGGTDSVTVTK